MTPLRPLLGTAEVAQRLGVHRETIRRWVKAGRLEPVHLPGRLVKFRPEDIDAIYGHRESDRGVA